MLHRLVRKADPLSPVLVMLHGVGSNEADLMSLAPELNPDLNLISLRAPHQYGPGYAWFNIEWDEHGLRVDEDQALDSLATLAAELQKIADEFKGSKVLLGGFSQGAIMTTGILLAHPHLIAGAALLSGRLLPRFQGLPPNAESSSISTLIQHGRFDPVLPIEGAHELRDSLSQRGIPLEYHEYDMAHQISMESVSDLRAWLSRH